MEALNIWHQEFESKKRSRQIENAFYAERLTMILRLAFIFQSHVSSCLKTFMIAILSSHPHFVSDASTQTEKAAGRDKRTQWMRETRKKKEEKEWNSGIHSKVEFSVNEERENGFLSSMEVCLIDGAHVFSMKKWENIKRELGMVNNMPSIARNTDFFRVREWCLEGIMSRFRQTFVLSNCRKYDAMLLFLEFENRPGRMNFIENPPSHGSMTDVEVSIRK